VSEWVGGCLGWVGGRAGGRSGGRAGGRASERANERVLLCHPLLRTNASVLARIGLG